MKKIIGRHKKKGKDDIKEWTGKYFVVTKEKGKATIVVICPSDLAI